jgi:protein ImuB
VSGSGPLLFVVRGLLARLSARLEGRGEAAQVLVVRLFHDRAIAEHRGVALEKELRFELAAPLWRETELERVVRSRLERTEVGAPTRGLEIVIEELTLATAQQLALTEGGKSRAEELPVLLAELGADVGSERVGVLELVDSHRPEAQSVLEPVRRARSTAQRKRTRTLSMRVTCAFTRLLAEPVQLVAQLRVGESVVVGPRLYSIERVRFVERLEGVGWWTETPASRDYLRLWLRGPEGGLDALVFVDRASGKRYLQALAD